MIDKLYLLKISLVMLFFWCLSVHGAYAGKVTPTGQDVAQCVFHRNIGKDSRAKMEMILRKRSGKERHRTFESISLDTGEARYGLIRFLSPKDIKGTTFLNISYNDGGTKQYLYLPALRRARRIAGTFKKRRFVNSDFTYEDLERRDTQKDEHRLIGDGVRLGRDCWVLESIPKKDADSQYSRIVQWVTKEGCVPVFMELYGRKHGKKVKVFEVRGLSEVQGILTVQNAVMKDLEKGHETQVVLHNIKYNVGVARDEFRVDRLGR